MKKETERMSITGTTLIERWYALARKHVAIIAKRERTRERCKHCFAMRFDPRSARRVLRHGCGGCAEMETFMEESRALFADGGEGARHDR